MAKTNGSVQSGGVVQSKVAAEPNKLEAFIPNPPGSESLPVPDVKTFLSNWDKFRERLLSLRGQMVTLTIMVGRDGEPICWATVDQRRVENLPAAPVA